ncbi:MAG TPA: NAD(P)H-dependent oxidoreductase subunit E, partial [Actinomycetes bacterium]
MSRTPGVEARAGRFPGPSLIPALHAIQQRRGWLPREELVALAADTRRPLYEIQGLVSFYPHFRTEPPPAVSVHLCHDLSCWLRGSDDRIADVRERYAGQADVEVREVSCLGRCDIAPAVAVNEESAAADRVDALVAAAREGGPNTAEPAEPAGSAGPTVPSRREPWPN